MAWPKHRNVVSGMLAATQSNHQKTGGIGKQRAVMAAYILTAIAVARTCGIAAINKVSAASAYQSGDNIAGGVNQHGVKA